MGFRLTPRSMTLDDLELVVFLQTLSEKTIFYNIFSCLCAALRFSVNWFVHKQVAANWPTMSGVKTITRLPCPQASLSGATVTVHHYRMGVLYWSRHKNVTI